MPRLSSPSSRARRLRCAGWFRRSRGGWSRSVAGSRSGTNAVAVWMILQSYGSAGGKAFCAELLRRTDRLCEQLTSLGVRFFREPTMNVIAMRAADVPDGLRKRYLLVPESHEGEPRWLKIVVMPHVSDALIDTFLAELEVLLPSATTQSE